MSDLAKKLLTNDLLNRLQRFEDARERISSAKKQLEKEESHKENIRLEIIDLLKEVGEEDNGVHYFVDDTGRRIGIEISFLSK